MKIEARPWTPQDLIDDLPELTKCCECRFAAMPNSLVQKYGIPGTRVCHNPDSPCRNRMVKPTDFCPYCEREIEDV
jgi:hypothetical protein